MHTSSSSSSSSSMSQLITWTVKRYVRYLVMGAVLSCAAVNVALHVGAGLEYVCEEDCTLQMLGGRISPMNRYLLEYIRSNMLDPGFAPGEYKPSFDVKHPPWSKLGRWGDAHDFVAKYFDQYGTPGRFVEVGAQDGEFMSMTLHLEQKGFQGLLVEPNPRDYSKLRGMRRTAMSVNACASPHGVTAKMPLWLRHNSGNLPPLLNRVQDGSNRLFTYVAKEDRDLGDVVTVQCFPLVSLVQAAFRVLQIDLLTISTHGGELDILSTLPTNFLVRVLVVFSGHVSEVDNKDFKRSTEALGLTQVYQKSNAYVFIPTGEVVVAHVQE